MTELATDLAVSGHSHYGPNYCEGAGGEDLCRIYARIDHKAGVPIMQVSRLLGHAGMETMLRCLYLDLNLDVPVPNAHAKTVILGKAREVGVRENLSETDGDPPSRVAGLAIGTE